MKPSMIPSGKLQLLLLPVLALLLAPPVAGWKSQGLKDGIANRHHLEGRQLHSVPNKDEMSLEDFETVSPASIEDQHSVPNKDEMSLEDLETVSPASIEDQLRQVNGLKAETDASFQKAFSVEDKVKADEQSSEYKVLQDLAARAFLPSPSAPTPVSLQAPVHESVGGLEDLDPAVGGDSAPGAKTGQAKMSNADQTPIDHRAQSANAPVALPTDKQAQAGRDRVNRAEAVASKIKNNKGAQADATMLVKYTNDIMRLHTFYEEEMNENAGSDIVARAETRLRAFYEEMNKNGGSDRVARAEALFVSVADKTNPKISQADKAPIDHHAQTLPKSSQSDKALIGHHVPPEQDKINAAAVISGMPPIPRPATAPSEFRDAAFLRFITAQNRQDQIDAALLIKYQNSPRLSSIYFEMRTHGGQDRVKRAKAMAQKMQG